MFYNQGVQLPAIFTLALVVITAALLISEKLRPDLVALLVLVALGISRVVSPGDAFAGFAGSAVMTIVGISIISEGLRQIGVTRSLGQLMFRLSAGSEARMVLVTTLVAAGLSLVMNNIAALGVLLPAVTTLARRAKTAPSRLMMPLAFGVSLGGMATLLTTANLIVSGALRDAGQRPYGLLDFLPIGAPVILVGSLYLLTIGRRLLPRRAGPGDRPPQQIHETLARLYGLERHLHQVEVLPGSPLAGRTIREGRWAQRAGLNILSLNGNERALLAPSPDEFIQAGDRLLVQGSPSPNLLESMGLRRLPGAHAAGEMTDAGTSLAELIISPHGQLVGKTLTQVEFRERYQLLVLGVWREGHAILNGLSELKLRVGDALLVQGTAERLQRLYADRDLLLLEEDPEAVLKPRKFALGLGITILTLAAAATDLLPVSIVVFAGAVLLILTGCLPMDDAYQAIEWKVVFLVAGMWPLSTAIRTTGLADLAVNALTSIAGSTSGLGAALILLLLALILTQITAGQVAALVLAPLALASAAQLGLDPRALGMAAALGCSLSFPTPFGHPVNLMVMTPGGYTFRDYLRVGLPLTVLVIAVILVGLRVFWGL